jgi:FdrA protein
MLYSIVKPNMYQDSLRLLHLSDALRRVEGVNQLSIMMGTPANKEVLRAAGLEAPSLQRRGRRI